MDEHPYLDMTEAYVLRTLEESERRGFLAHLRSGCPVCQKSVTAHEATLLALAQGHRAQPSRDSLRAQLLDLAEAPALPLDVAAYTWTEILPGIKVHVMRDDPEGGLRACLVWAKPGAKHPAHRHVGDENILVLQGGFRDERGFYRAGDICRSGAGSIHTEQALSGEDCVCYVVYYGAVEEIGE